MTLHLIFICPQLCQSIVWKLSKWTSKSQSTAAIDDALDKGSPTGGAGQEVKLVWRF